MELVEGETLEAYVRRRGRLPVSVALDIAEQVARALSAAEVHGLVHRDLKPTNVMVVANDADTADGLTVKVIDFGLAKPIVATRVTSDKSPLGGFSGTPGFASPEQLAGEQRLARRAIGHLLVRRNALVSCSAAGPLSRARHCESFVNNRHADYQ